MKRILTNHDIEEAAERVAETIHKGQRLDKATVLYGIPRGGIPAAYAVRAALADLDPAFSSYVCDDPKEATHIIDDIRDSGRTAKTYELRFGKPVLTLYNRETLDPGDWLIFPWEGDSVGSIDDAVVRVLQYIGEDPQRNGLKETPARVVRALTEYTCGYNVSPASVLKTFDDGAERYDEMVVVRDIPFYSLCEHHMAPFFGRATIGYIPDGRIVGLSKLSRLLDVFARRLQVQERLTAQIADALDEHLKPRGAGVVITARHLCMESRGVCKQGHETTTSALRGVFSKGEVRNEFLNLR